MNYHDPKPVPDAFERALAGYDVAHRQELEEAIIHAIVNASLISEPKVLALRTGEIADALTNILSATLALSPSVARSPAAIRKITDELRRKVVRKVAEARANPDFQDFERRIFRDGDEKRGGRA